MNFCKFGACILEFFVILVMVCFSVFLLSSQSAVRYDRSKVDIVSEDENFLEGYIKTTNGNIYFKITGRNKTKTPLILIHGGPGACHDYFEPLSILSDERPVIFYDQLGCGNSDKPEDISIYTVENYVTELSEVRDALGLLEVHILGQSWGGGLLAVYASSEKATGIKSAVFSSPLIDSERWIFDQKSYLSMMPEEIQKSVSLAEKTGDYESSAYQNAIDEYYKLHLCRLSPWPEVLVKSFEKTSVPVYMSMWGPSEFTCTGKLKTFNQTEKLFRIKVPVLFLCGEYDEAKPSTI